MDVWENFREYLRERFLIYYMITGIGAAFIHLLISQYQIISISNQIPELVSIAIEGKYNPSIPLSKINTANYHTNRWGIWSGFWLTSCIWNVVSKCPALFIFCHSYKS